MSLRGLLPPWALLALPPDHRSRTTWTPTSHLVMMEATIPLFSTPPQMSFMTPPKPPSMTVHPTIAYQLGIPAGPDPAWFSMILKDAEDGQVMTPYRLICRKKVWTWTPLKT